MLYFVIEMSSQMGSSDKAHRRGQGAHWHLHLGLPWKDLPSGIPSFWDPWKVRNNEDLPSAEQNWVREYLNSLFICRLMGSGRMHSGAGEAGQCHCVTILDYLWKIMVFSGWRFLWAVKSKWHSSLQEKQKEDGEERQASQPHLSA